MSSSEQKRRYKKVGLTRELMYGTLFRESDEDKWERITGGVPQDANFVTLHEDPERDLHWLIFSHDEWEHIPLGEEIPEITVEVETRVAKKRTVLERF